MSKNTRKRFDKLSHRCAAYYAASRWHKFLILGASVLTVVILIMYGISQWYILSSRSTPLVRGATFIPHYAESLGVDPEETMDELIDIGINNFRLVSYWNDTEREPGTYDFTKLDWQFKKAEAANAKILLTVGLRQPRWPECHMPKWAEAQPVDKWEPALMTYIETVVNRYKNSPSLVGYQVENEFFLRGFGNCTDFRRERLVAEYDLVKRLDPDKTIIVSRSNNAVGFPIGAPTPDTFGIAVYKRVWDAAVTKRYLEYPFPAWFYGYLAGVQKIYTGKDMILAELQAEAWPPRGKPIAQTSLDEQNKSLNADRLKHRFAYGEATGMRTIYMWGAEYWYYRLVVLDDPSLWEVAKEEFAKQ